MEIEMPSESVIRVGQETMLSEGVQIPKRNGNLGVPVPLKSIVSQCK